MTNFKKNRTISAKIKVKFQKNTKRTKLRKTKKRKRKEKSVQLNEEKTTK